jgi:2-hydroxychromene-2-carboxylate isomerase
MTLAVDLFFSFRSPYSYLALPKTLKKVEAGFPSRQTRSVCAEIMLK